MELFRFYEMLRSHSDWPWTFDIELTIGATNPYEGFNKGIYDALQKGADAVWLFDSDMSPAPCCASLLEHIDKADLLCPAVRGWSRVEGTSEVNPVVMAGIHNPVTKKFLLATRVMDEVPYEVDAAATGGLFIWKRVLEDERSMVEPGWTPPAWFRDVRDPNGHMVQSGDYDFTFRCRNLGYKNLLVPSAIVGHWHMKNVDDVVEYGDRVALAVQQYWINKYEQEVPA